MTPITTTVSGLLVSLADSRGDATAIIVPGRDPVSFRALRDAAARLALGLRSEGVERGDRVAAFLPNSLAMVELFLAAGSLGAVFIGLNTRYRADDLEHALEASAAKFLFPATDFLGIDFPGVVAGALDGMDHAPRVVWPDELDRLRSGAANDAGEDGGAGLPDDARPDDILVAFTTTGTTGRPKLAAHDHITTLRHGQSIARALAITVDDVGLLSLPICGAYGLTTWMSWMVAGATIVVPERFEPADAAGLIEQYRVTRMNGSDDMMLPVLAAGADLSSWRQAVQAEFTGNSARAVAEADRIGLCITGGYGSSELFAVIGAQSLDDSSEQRALNGGHLVDDAMQVRVADVATGEVLGPGIAGELQFRGPSVLTTYLGNPDAMRQAFTADGWFRTGDFGETSEDGSFVYLARLKDSLRLSGFLTDPAEIEQRFLAHPGVEAAAVVGVRGPTGADVAVAFVVLSSGSAGEPATEADLLAHCRHGLANYKVPVRVGMVKALPVVEGPNGSKVLKSELREWAVELIGEARSQSENGTPGAVAP